MTYQPREDSYLIKKHIRKFARGEVLDMGTGSGILAREAAKYADKVLAVDINEQALLQAKKAAKQQKLTNIRFKQSDLFSKIKEEFNLIIFNPPYLPRDKGIEDKSIYGGKHGYEIIERLLMHANDHLDEKGIILLLFSSLTNKQKVDQFIQENLFQATQIDQQKLFFETLYVYKLQKSDILRKLKEIKDLKPLAKGKRGLVYTGIYKKNKVVIKIKNPKSTAINRLQNEANTLNQINHIGIGPKLITSHDDFIIMEYIEGTSILEYLEIGAKKQIIKVIQNLLEQLNKLDKIGINKKEMHKPYKHIIIKNNKPVLIDFDRAKKTQKPHNVTQFCQFLISEKTAKLLTAKNININAENLKSAAKNYSQDIDKIVSLIT